MENRPERKFEQASLTAATLRGPARRVLIGQPSSRFIQLTRAKAARELGIAEVFTKPVSPSFLFLATVDVLCGGHTVATGGTLPACAHRNTGSRPMLLPDKGVPMEAKAHTINTLFAQLVLPEDRAAIDELNLRLA